MFDMSSDDDYDIKKKGKNQNNQVKKPNLLESDDEDDTFVPEIKKKNAPAPTNT